MLHRLLHDIEKISPNKKRLSKYFSAFHSDCNGNMSLCGLKKECLIAASELVPAVSKLKFY